MWIIYNSFLFDHECSYSFYSTFENSNICFPILENSLVTSSTDNHFLRHTTLHKISYTNQVFLVLFSSCYSPELAWFFQIALDLYCLDNFSLILHEVFHIGRGTTKMPPTKPSSAFRCSLALLHVSFWEIAAYCSSSTSYLSLPELHIFLSLPELHIIPFTSITTHHNFHFQNYTSYLSLPELHLIHFTSRIPRS